MATAVDDTLLSLLAHRQPAPVNRGVPVNDVAMRWLHRVIADDAERADVCAVVRRRGEAGVKKYGQPLMSDDGRDKEQDALEELFDAMVYIVSGKLGGVRMDRIGRMHSLLGALIAEPAARLHERAADGDDATATPTYADEGEVLRAIVDGRVPPIYAQYVVPGFVAARTAGSRLFSCVMTACAHAARAHGTRSSFGPLRLGGDDNLCEASWCHPALAEARISRRALAGALTLLRAAGVRSSVEPVAPDSAAGDAVMLCVSWLER